MGYLSSYDMGIATCANSKLCRCAISEKGGHAQAAIVQQDRKTKKGTRMQINNPGETREDETRFASEEHPPANKSPHATETTGVIEKSATGTDCSEANSASTQEYADNIHDNVMGGYGNETGSKHQPSAAQQSADQYQYQQFSVPPTTPAGQYGYAPSEPSPFSLGWQDIKNTPEAASSIGFKGLVNCVPILNFCFYGMSGKWGREPVDGIVRPMPKKVVDSDNFLAGFLFFVIVMALGFVLGAVNFVPVLGQIVSFVGMFFVETLAFMMFYRYLAFGSFAEAWDLKDIWQKAKRNFGSLWVATFIPNLICGSIAMVVSFLIVLVFGLVSGLSVIGIANSGSIAGVLGLIGSLGIGGLLCFAVNMFASAVGMLWASRATGYWVAKNVPEWNSSTAKSQRAAKEAQRAQAAAEAQAMYQAQAQAWQQQQQQQQHVAQAPYTQQTPYQTSYAQQPSTPVPPAPVESNIVSPQSQETNKNQ